MITFRNHFRRRHGLCCHNNTSLLCPIQSGSISYILIGQSVSCRPIIHVCTSERIRVAYRMVYLHRFIIVVYFRDLKSRSYAIRVGLHGDLKTRHPFRRVAVVKDLKRSIHLHFYQSEKLLHATTYVFRCLWFSDNERHPL